MIASHRSAAKPPRFFAALLLLVGLAFAAPGAKLLSLGGTPYYVIAGVAVILSAILLWRGDGRGVWLYFLTLAGTVAWAIAEAGFDGWALMPRVTGPLLFGLWLALPVTRRGLSGAAARAKWPLAAVAAAVALLAAGIVFSPSDNILTAAETPDRPAAPSVGAPAAAEADWTEYGRDKAGSRFSPLQQINASNVAQLQPVWSYRAGIPANLRVSLETTPLKVGDRLYFCTGDNNVVALDAETGQQAWRFDPKINPSGLFAGTCRGVAYYRAPDAASACAERIITATVDRRLIALNARDGAPCADFGANGVVSLDAGMGMVDPGYYHVTSAPQIIRGKVVLGGWVTDGQYVGEPSGVIRAFDAVTGKFAWAWDMGRPDKHDEPGQGESYTRGTPNSWAPISADEELGMVYLPTGNATPDYYGGHRRDFDDRYSSSVVALDAETGAVKWSFQTTHHDLWDYDVASQPTLVDLPGGVKALVQPTKRGELFLLDRVTGQPLAQVEEKPVPQAGMPGDKLSGTQPFSTGMPSFAGPMPTEERMWGVTPFDQMWCRIAFRQARFDGTMTPVGLDRPTVTFPGYLGGMNWGSVSVDENGVLITNTNRVGNYNRLLTRKAADAMGIKPFSASGHGDVGGPVAQAGTPYAAHIQPFLSPLAIPCTQPPFGMISAVDLKTHKLIWTKPFGTGMDSGPLTIPSHLPLPMGVPSIGGPVTTRSGIFFIAASQDKYLRAYDTATGRELWKARLPAGGQATPMTYWSEKSGRQFVVIAAGGHGGLLTTPGDYILAFALPDSAIKKP